MAARKSSPSQPAVEQGGMVPCRLLVGTNSSLAQGKLLPEVQLSEHLQKQLGMIWSHATSLNHGVLSLSLLPKSSPSHSLLAV